MTPAEKIKELHIKIIAVCNAVYDRERMVTPEDRVEAIEVAENAKDEVKTFLIQTIISTLEEQVEKAKKREITKESYPFHANFKPIEWHVTGFNQALQDTITSLEVEKERWELLD